MKIKEIWRYPVKSMQGESLPAVQIGEYGLDQDRIWAIRDGVTTRGAKNFPQLMEAKATLNAAGVPVVTLPDGSSFPADSVDVHKALSDFCGKEVTLEPLKPASEINFYKRVREERSEAETRAYFGIGDDDPFPDFSRFPPTLAQYSSPPGTFFDCFPLHIMTTSSLNALQVLAPQFSIDSRRFRPNLLIETDDDGFPETKWEGKQLKVGASVINLTLMCPRCSMPTFAFEDLPKEPGIMRTLVEHCQHSIGIYAEVAEAGSISVGDNVELC